MTVSNDKPDKIDDLNTPDPLKEKSKRRAAPLPVDFVIPLQPEECIYRLQTLPLPAALRLNIQTQAETGEMTFTATYVQITYSELSLQEEREDVIDASGAVQRWEGTSTRFKGQAEFPGYELLSTGCFVNLLLTLLLFGGLQAGLSFLAEHDRAIRVNGGGLFLLLGIGTIFYLMISTPLWFRLEHYQLRRQLVRAIRQYFEK